MGKPAEVLQFPGEIGDRKIYVVHKGTDSKDHPAIQISISRQDSVHWTSYSKRFRVSRLEFLSKEKGAGDPPPHPFYRKFPDDSPHYEVQINSGPARPEAEGCTYEAFFEFEDGSHVDPHIQIGK
jgi:hypothetical protein